jgi:hypothetical protein
MRMKLVTLPSSLPEREGEQINKKERAFAALSFLF